MAGIELRLERKRITKGNFETVFHDFQESVRNASLATLDVRFTHPLPAYDSYRWMNSMRERLEFFEKVLDKTSPVYVSIGLVTLFPVLPGPGGTAASWTLYDFLVFPGDCAGHDTHVWWHASSLETVANETDYFENAAKHGLSFCTKAQAEHVRRRISDNPGDPMAALFGHDSKPASDYVDACAKLFEWVYKARKNEDDDKTYEVDLSKFSVPTAVALGVMSRVSAYCTIGAMGDDHVLKLGMLSDADLKKRSVNPYIM